MNRLRKWLLLKIIGDYAVMANLEPDDTGVKSVVHIPSPNTTGFLLHNVRLRCGSAIQPKQRGSK